MQTILTRRLQPPRTASGDQDYGPAAGLAASATGTVCCAISAMLAVDSHALHDHPALATTALVVSAMLPALAVYTVARRVLPRTGLFLWQGAVVMVALATALIVAPRVSDHVFPSPWQRYDRQYGTGCLTGTPYAGSEAGLSLHGRELRVFGITREIPVLRLGPARQGSTRPLAPLDAASREILRQHSC